MDLESNEVTAANSQIKTPDRASISDRSIGNDFCDITSVLTTESFDVCGKSTNCEEDDYRSLLEREGLASMEECFQQIEESEEGLKGLKSSGGSVDMISIMQAYLEVLYTIVNRFEKVRQSVY